MIGCFVFDGLWLIRFIFLFVSGIFEFDQDGRFLLVTVNNTLFNQVVLEVLLALPDALCVDEGGDKELATLTRGSRKTGSRLIDRRLEQNTVFHVSRY